MTEQKHTATPYHIGKSHTIERAIRDQDGECIAVICDNIDGTMEHNANFIVKACNSHYELFEVCKALLRCPHIRSSGPGYSTIEITDFNLKAAREAIAKATK